MTLRVQTSHADPVDGPDTVKFKERDNGRVLLQGDRQDSSYAYTKLLYWRHLWSLHQQNASSTLERSPRFLRLDQTITRQAMRRQVHARHVEVPGEILRAATPLPCQRYKGPQPSELAACQ